MSDISQSHQIEDPNMNTGNYSHLVFDEDE